MSAASDKTLSDFADRRAVEDRKEALRSALDNVPLTEAREVCAEYGFVYIAPGEDA